MSLIFSRGIEGNQWHKIGQKLLTQIPSNKVTSLSLDTKYYYMSFPKSKANWKIETLSKSDSAK